MKTGIRSNYKLYCTDRGQSRRQQVEHHKQQYPGQGKRVNKNTGNGSRQRQTIIKREQSRVQNTGKAKQDNEMLNSVQ